LLDKALKGREVNTMTMDYKHLSKVMMDKYSTQTSLRILSDISYADAEEIIMNIDNPQYLMKLDSEAEKAKITRVLRHIKSIIHKKIHTLVQ
jgi:hypothetical protein